MPGNTCTLTDNIKGGYAWPGRNKGLRSNQSLGPVLKPSMRKDRKGGRTGEGQPLVARRGLPPCRTRGKETKPMFSRSFQHGATASQITYRNTSLPANRTQGRPIQINPELLYHQLPELPIPAPRFPGFAPNPHLFDTLMLATRDIIDQNHHLL